MSKTELLQKRCWRVVYWLSVAGFLFCVASAFKPGYGFTGLIEFGDLFSTRSITGLNCYVEPKSAGYDGQFYAKLALDPLVRHPADDEQQIDNLYYRSRRILLSWTAWAAGLGRPAWIMQVFALQNVVCWLVLAWVLTRWFPPLDFNNYARWAGILFSYGLMSSVRSSLTDGPSFLFITLGLAFCERNRGTWAAGMLAIAGLTRETSLLAFVAMVEPSRRSLRDLARLALLGAMAAAPLLCWILYLHLRLGNPEHAMGTKNFGLPLVAWWQKWVLIISELGHSKWARLAFPVQFALTVQAFFLLARPAISKPVWRMGAAFAVLMFFLGSSVWEGLPGATARSVLPMLLAFNILVPRGRWWLAVLLAGNLCVVAQPFLYILPPGDAAVVDVQDSRLPVTDVREYTVRFGPEWYDREGGFLQTWRRWSKGTAGVTIHNPNPFAVDADFRMTLSTRKGDANRAISVQVNGREIWAGTLTDQQCTPRAQSVRLEPGDNTLVFKTADAVVAPGANESRRLAFCLRDLRIDMRSVPTP